MTTNNWVIASLAKTHDRSQFDCGEPVLNEFIRNYARQNQNENIGRTWVATHPGQRNVLGFHTLTVASVAREQFASEEVKRLPRYPVPVAHLGRLAVDLSARGTGLGEHLLLHALEQVLRVSQVVGIFAAEVRAKEEKAKRFYEHYGFKRMLDDDLHLYLSVKVLAKLFGER
jgi:ribosomal protein S18 acetylase RimI-like enzyme